MFEPTKQTTPDLPRDDQSYLNTLRDLAAQVDGFIARINSQPVRIKIEGVDEVTPLVDRIVADIASRTIHLPFTQSPREPHVHEHGAPKKHGLQNASDPFERAKRATAGLPQTLPGVPGQIGAAISQIKEAIEHLPETIATLPGKIIDFAEHAKKAMPDLVEKIIQGSLRAEKHPELAQSYQELHRLDKHKTDVEAQIAREHDPEKQKSLQKELDQTNAGIKQETAHIQAQQKLIDALPPNIDPRTADINERTKEINLRAGNQPKAAQLAHIQYQTEKQYHQSAGDLARQQAILAQGMAEVKNLQKGRTEVGFSDPLSSWHKMQEGGESIKSAAEKLEKLFGDAKPFSVVTMQSG